MYEMLPTFTSEFWDLTVLPDCPNTKSLFPSDLFNKNRP